MTHPKEDAFDFEKRTPSIDVRKPSKAKPDHQLEENSKENLDQKLDSALDETCEASDPVSVTITK